MRKAFGALVDSRTWGELLYALIGIGLGILGFVVIVVGLAVGMSTVVILIGFPILIITLVVARGFGAVYRGLGRGLLGVLVDAPTRGPQRRSLRGYLTDRRGWRAVLFVLVQFPVAVLDFVVAVTMYSLGVGFITYALWRETVPVQHVAGVAHRGAQLTPHYFLDTPARIVVTELVGLVSLLLAPWVLRGVLTLDRLLIRSLLGPSAADERIRDLEATRAMAVDDSAASLRRIERDLHDGAQARLVSLAMSLGLAKEELDTVDDPAVALTRVRELVDTAHREAKGTIVDLRDLARGIHPPALDNGLPDALTTLTARCAIPTTLHIELPERPPPAIETIVYFCTAELLTNVAKHSGAHHASVDVRVVEDCLFLRVGDDGAGGATPHRSGSGLKGLTDRIATVDGRLDIASPQGGPTLVTVGIPT